LNSIVIICIDMDGLIKRSAVVFLIFSFFAVLNNTAEAVFPAIIYIKGTPSTDSIVVEASINGNNSQGTAWVEYSTDSNLVNHKETNHVIIDPTYNENFVFMNMVNLNPNTLYYLRVVTNNEGNITIRSNIVAIQTLAIYNPPQNQVASQSTNTTPAINNNTSNTNTNQNTNETQSTNTSGLGANVLFSQKFFPNTIPNWIAFIAILAIITVLIRKVYLDGKNS